ISALRNIRGEMNLPPSRPLILQLQHASDNDRRLAQAFKPWLQKLGRVESVWIVPEGVPVADAASALLGDLKLLVPLGDLIDRDAERKRLGRELEKVGVDLQRATAKLANPNFVERAPAAVVEKERARAVELRQALEKLSEQMAKVAAL
ncbi:MAG: valine--tRNA ligase, partial [Gammaproteobacteria bacterium]|nr:valine--tRNA ligase [Gammaproteobacteria bacterium]